MKKIIMVLVVMPLVVFAETETMNGVEWSFTIFEGKATVTSANPVATELEIPLSLGGCPVTCIGDYAFSYNKDLTSVTISDGVTSIGRNAFQGCNGLRSLSIPPKVAGIGEWAFSYCDHLTSVTVLGNVKSIGAKAFHDCPIAIVYVQDMPQECVKQCFGNDVWYQKLDMPIQYEWRWEKDGDGAVITGVRPAYGDIEIPAFVDGHPVTGIGQEAFRNCEALTSVTIPFGVLSIGQGAFFDCNGLTNVVIPASVTDIGVHAFLSCDSLVSVEIPSSVRSIEYLAFCSCEALVSIAVDASNPVYSSEDGILYDKDKNSLIACPAGKEGEVRIPSTVIRIEDSAFESCIKLTKVILSEGLKSIRNNSFCLCTGLTSIEIPDSVTSIGYYAFGQCTGLMSVTIPSGVIRIEDRPFLGCTSLLSIDVDEDNANFSSEDGVLYDKKKSVLIACPAGREGDVTVPDSVMTIGALSFYDCSKLTNVTIPSGVMSIGMAAFYGCSGLTSVVIPSSVTSIEETAFYGCAGLTTVTLPEGLTKISDHMFFECKGLRSVTIPVGVTCVEDYAFSYCSGLTSVAFPSSVRSIGKKAFFDCSELMNIYVSQGDADRVKQMLADSGFSNVDDLLFVCTEMTQDGVPWRFVEEDDAVSIGTGIRGEGAIPDNATGPIVIPSILGGRPVTRIQDYAFEGCGGLTAVTIPSSVTKIGEDAFLGCENLKRVDVESLDAWLGITFANDAANPLSCGATLYVNGEMVDVVRVTFDTNGGEDVAPRDLPCGVTIGALPRPVRGNDEFVGWFTEPFGGEEIDETYIIQEDVTIYAHWLRANGGPYTEVRDGVTWTFMVAGGLARVGTGSYSQTAVDKATTGELQIPNELGGRTVAAIGDYAFYGCSLLTSVLIPSSVTSVGRVAFYGCATMGDVCIPYSVTSVSYDAFRGCSGVTNLVIDTEPDSYCSWMEWFADCRSVKTATVPGSSSSSANSSSYYTLSRMFPNLEELTFTEGTVSIPYQMCAGLTKLSKVELPSSLKVVGSYGFRGCSSLEKIDLPEGLTTVGDYAFSECVSLVSADMPSTVTSMGRDVFAGCKKLIIENLYIPGESSSVNYNAYYGMEGIKSVVIGEGVYSIGSSAFEGCSGMTNIVFPSSLQRIGSDAFRNCVGLGEITLPENLMELGSQAFYGCTNLTTVTILSERLWLSGDPFANCVNLAQLNIRVTSSMYPGMLRSSFIGYPSHLLTVNVLEPCGELPRYSFGGCMFVKELNLPEGLIKIGYGAVEGCHFLERVKLPSSLKTIDDYAFANCLNLIDAAKKYSDFSAEI